MSFTEEDLRREGGWTRGKQCFDVGEYHLNVRLGYIDPWDFRVVIRKRDRVVFEATVDGPVKAAPPSSRDFTAAAMAAMNEAIRLMLVDQPSLGQEAVYIDGVPEPATFYMNAPC